MANSNTVASLLGRWYSTGDLSEYEKINHVPVIVSRLQKWHRLRFLARRKGRLQMIQREQRDSNRELQSKSTERAARDGSAYCDYDEVFKGYDQIRQPYGLAELLQIFGQSDVPLREQEVLDGGFGTGTYIERIRHRVGVIYGVEPSAEGYRQAIQKMDGATNVHLQIGDILQLPFPDEYFDAYMVNQVVHHLDTEPSVPNLDVFLSEARRVLARAGQLTINTCSQEQMDPDFGVYWHHRYIQSAARTLQARYVPIEQLVSRLEGAGFVEIMRTIPSGRMYHKRYYYEPAFALEPGFPKGDSAYSFLSPKEIELANARVRAAIEDGSVYDQMKRTAEHAGEIGEAIIISARRVA